MKKLMIALIFVAFLFSTLPVSATAAAPLALPVCSISNWNYNGISGGCTCYVAERVLAATGKAIPWGGNASAWWANSSGRWNRNTDEPRKGAIAAFSYGHVSYVDSVVLKNSQTAKIKTQPYVTYSVPFPVIAPWIKFTVTATATQYEVTETYTVNAKQRDYSRIVKNDNTVRDSNWQATKKSYYWSRDPRYPFHYWSTTLVPALPADKWTTLRTGGANGLQGYIYP